MVQAWPAALFVTECDLPVAHRAQWNINQALTGALVKIYQAPEGLRCMGVVSPHFL